MELRIHQCILVDDNEKVAFLFSPEGMTSADWHLRVREADAMHGAFYAPETSHSDLDAVIVKVAQGFSQAEYMAAFITRLYYAYTFAISSLVVNLTTEVIQVT